MTGQSKQSLDEAFESWWYNEGSGIIPLPGNDHEEHGYRISRIAWHNGAYIALNALATHGAAVEIRTEPGFAEIDEVIRVSDIHAIARELERLPD